MIEFRLFGIQVYVHPWHWLLLAFFGGAIEALEGRVPWIAVGLFVIAGFLSILVHEFGHALTIRKYNLPTEVHLTGMGGHATLPPSRISRKQSFLITAAGPGIQLVLAGMAKLIYDSGQLPDTYIVTFFYYLFYVSFFWALLNCLPILPMDGGQMLRAILGPRRESTTFKVGMITGVICCVVSIVFYPGFIFLPILMGLFAFENWQLYQRSK